MKPIVRYTLVFQRALVFAALLWGQLSVAQTPSPQSTQATLPSETPAHFEAAAATFDYMRRDVMIPMRDRVKLHTVILVPKGAKNAPILLTRTPYDATALTSHIPSSHLGLPSTAMTTRPMSSSKAATFAWSRMCAASTAPRETT